MPNATSAADASSVEAEALAVPLGPAIEVLPALKRVVATKVIPRDVGPDIAPDQAVWLPATVAEVEIKAGHARDPDAESAGKSKT